MDETRPDNLSTTLNQGPSRDEEYYFEDGNCVIQAECHLFKVHRSILKRNSLFFKNMFELAENPSSGPGTVDDAEGSTDENPIICQDSAVAFRSLCWILYANPQDVCAQRGPGRRDLNEIFRIAFLAHKYEFTAFLEWSFDIILLHLPDGGSIQGVSVNDFQHLLCIASESEGNRRGLVAKIQQRLISAILQSEDPLAMFITILQVAERIKDRNFQGKVYYAYLQATHWKAPPTRSPQSSPLFGRSHSASQTPAPRSRVSIHNISADLSYRFRSLAGLSDVQRLRLHYGYQSLIVLRRRLDDCPDLGRCGHNSCENDWCRWWNEQINAPFSDDPGSLLDEMHGRAETFKANHIAQGRTADRTSCREARQKSIMALSQAIEDSLADRFVCI